MKHQLILNARAIVQVLADYSARISRNSRGWTSDYEAFLILLTNLKREAPEVLTAKAERLTAEFTMAHRQALACRRQSAQKKPSAARRRSTDTAVSFEKARAIAADRAAELLDWIDRNIGIKGRLTIDLESCSATLDGQVYTGFDLDALRFFKAIADKAGKSTSGVKLFELAFNAKGNQRTVGRTLDLLCPEFRKLVKGKRGRGYYLELPP